MLNKSQFFTQLLALTGVVTVASFAIEQFTNISLHPYHWGILLYNVALTALSFLILSRGIGEGKDGWDFNNHFMGNTAFRLLITASLLLVYYYWIKIEKISFTVTFFAFYFAYTIFEIRHLLSNLRQNSERIENTDGK